MRGLAFLHDLGVVHRHVRPSNILLDRSGGAKIRDGCVARAFESYKESEDESALIFKAPEYLRGGAPTTKVDSYALGLTILETVTGRAAERPTESFSTLLELAEDAFLDEDDPAPLRSRADPNDGAEGETWRPFHREVSPLCRSPAPAELRQTPLRPRAARRNPALAPPPLSLGGHPVRDRARVPREEDAARRGQRPGAALRGDALGAREDRAGRARRVPLPNHARGASDNTVVVAVVAIEVPGGYLCPNEARAPSRGAAPRPPLQRSCPSTHAAR